MNYDEIKKLIDDMGNSKIDELNIEFPEGIKISMKKDKRRRVYKYSEISYGRNFLLKVSSNS